jgi:hypothetical protein
LFFSGREEDQEIQVVIFLNNNLEKSFVSGGDCFLLKKRKKKALICKLHIAIFLIWLFD